ncbi:putative haloacid dehalogenase-like hydrolase [Buchnera aphidicola str. Bp (Baizongia pistaciae)]|uniref:Putative phosphatase bbp_030 n=1 Tax=Buchnera aphidicola subsp. Baizongia pistaciae (strain Bp) TaxID=224915 RepID=Y030_BUCBP|nr:Cof-type HAD-IIB family hydrolase [Buchnera aphidicola]Q89B25.1 RecName: Full=Putative phosphatase bbp_030 [Buchnera aphidicola str. Bp (Baizongia pistaciae)]AAO26773.1 putative haloacid dehalogenase-like hydrolase [Buchnera aphidicola str. Bp (Baizongia pistaciae)]
MYYIVASDLDGTLLSPQFYLTEYTKKIIKRLVNKGIYFVIATGRHYNEAKEIQKMLNVPVFLITSNGARIYDLNKKLIYSCDIEQKVVKELLQKCLLNHDILIQLYSHNNWYVSNNNYSASSLYVSFSFRSKIFEFKTIIKKKISKIFFTCKNVKKLLCLEKYIISHWGKYVNVSFSFLNCLEIMSKTVSKGNSLQLIANMLGLSIKNCISFGDGMNDKEMLDMSGKGCMMDNSHYLLKKSLPNLEIIGSNKFDSVAMYLNKIYFKK